MFKIAITLFSAVFLSSISGYMTVMGYANMFNSAFVSAIILFTALEFSKVVIAYRAKLDMLLIFEAILIVFAAIGHFGFLSEAYWKDKLVYDAVASSTVKEDRRYLDKEKSLNQELKQIQDAIEALNNPTNKIRYITSTKPRVDEIRKELDSLRDAQITTTENKTTTVTHNTIKYAADTAGMDENTFAKLVIYIASLTIDPLALALIFTFSKDIEKRRRETHSGVTYSVLNVKDYDIAGITVDDIVACDDSSIKSMMFNFNTKHKKEWLHAALCWRDAEKRNNTPTMMDDGAKILSRILNG